MTIYWIISARNVAYPTSDFLKSAVGCTTKNCNVLRIMLKCNMLENAINTKDVKWRQRVLKVAFKKQIVLVYIVEWIMYIEKKTNYDEVYARRILS